jgi:thiamine transport system substrate-binding protein
MKMKRSARLALFSALFPFLLGSMLCLGADSELTLMAHDSFNVSKEVVARFESQFNVKLRFLKSGDAGSAVNQAILSKNNPLADVFFGVDSTFMSRALKAGIFEVYQSPLLAEIPDHLQLDKENRLLPVDFGDVCLNYDKKWFAKHKITPPSSLEDLIKPSFANLTVVENPATSSPGLAFLFATIGHFGEAGYLQYWKDLRAANVLVVNGWEEAYWGHFSAASKGNRPIVVSYASSPPVEVFYAKVKLQEAPTAVVVQNSSCYRQIEFVGILKGTAKRELAEKLVDFLLGVTFQEDIPLQMFVFPANNKAKQPEVFLKYATVAENPVILPSELITANREKWIEDWTDVVLR